MRTVRPSFFVAARRSGFALALCAYVVLPAATNAGGVSEADGGHIAVIEDAAGVIVPASGACDNLAYLMYPKGICLPRAGEAFYFTHPDQYDALVFVTTASITSFNDNKAAAPLKADVAGINYSSSPWNYKHLTSNGRLEVAVTLGTLSSMPDNPEDPFSWPPVRGVEVVAHEIAHRWLAYINIDLGDGQGSRDILRSYTNETSGNHWSCWFNNFGSIQHGGNLTDNGGGSFTDYYGVRRFSPLDQYLMGIRDAADVGPMWYVVVGYDLHGCDELPGTPGGSKNFVGERVDFTIDDVIRANGARSPARSACHLKVGLVLVHPAGTPPAEADLEKMERYRLALEAYWIEASDGRGSLDTRLDGCGVGADSCRGTQSVQCAAAIDGDVDDAAEQDQADADLASSDQPAESDPVETGVDAADVADTPSETMCTPLSLRCLGAMAQWCAEDGGSWELLENCGTKVCLDGKCIAAGGDGDPDATGSGSKSSGCAGGGGVGSALLALAALRNLLRKHK